MTAKRVVGVVVVLLAAAAIWVLWIHPGGGAEAPAVGSGSGKRVAQVDTIAPAAVAPAASDAPRGVAPKWSLDIDPAGPLELDGQVVGPDGKGMEAEVWIDSVPARSAKSDASGNFQFDKLVGRAYELTATGGELVGGPVTYKLTGKSDPLVIRLGEGASIDVSVRDEAGKPIPKAEVSTGAEGGRTATTGDDGRATLRPVHTGFVVATAKAPGFAPAGSFATVGSAGAHGQMTIVLRAGVPVSGRVIDDKGKPLAKVHVTVGDAATRGFGMGGRGDRDGADTDDKGQFSFPAVASGSHELVGKDGEHEPTTGSPFAVGDKPVTGLELKMKAGGSIAGTVVDKGGNPVPFASVRVSGSGRRMWTVAARQTTSDKRGAFELRGLARAKLQIRAESDTDASKIVEVDLEAHADARDLKLVLDVGGMISGVVVDDQGSPVPEVSVNAFPDLFGGASTESIALAGMSSTTTDGAGAFTVHGLPDGAYKLWAQRGSSSANDWGQHGASAKVGDKSVRITLPGVGSLIGRLKIDGQEAPPTLASITVGYQMPTPLVGGTFQIKDLPSGSYDVHFRGADFAAFTQHDVHIAPGKPTDMGIVLVFRGRKLTGTVVDASGSPVAGAKVKVGTMLFSGAGAEDPNQNFDDLAGIRSAITDADGGFQLIGVPRKETNVVADHPDKGRSLAQAVPLTDGDPPPMELKLRGFGSIAGVVTSKGQPLSGVTVSESSTGGTAQAMFAQTGADGSYAMAKVPEGQHVLNALQPAMMSLKSTSVTASVTVGKQSIVNIDIPVGSISLDVTVKALPGNKVDAAQVFLFHGAVSPANGKQLTDGIFQAGVQGMKFWFGPGKPDAVFDELVAGPFTICTVPITGDMSDPTFLGRIQENMESIKVYCKPVTVAPAPATQTAESDVPAMAPLPAGNGSGSAAGSGQ